MNDRLWDLLERCYEIIAMWCGIALLLAIAAALEAVALHQWLLAAAVACVGVGGMISAIVALKAARVAGRPR